MKVKMTFCDVCNENVSGEFQYRFRYWHWRTGTFHKLCMCSNCFQRLQKFVAKEKEEALAKMGGKP